MNFLQKIMLLRKIIRFPWNVSNRISPWGKLGCILQGKEGSNTKREGKKMQKRKQSDGDVKGKLDSWTTMEGEKKIVEEKE